MFILYCSTMEGAWTLLTGDQAVAWFWVPMGTSLHLTAFLLVTAHCLMHRREAVSALLWIFLAWSFPVLGPLTYLGFGVNRVPLKAWRKQRSDQELLKERRSREDEAMPMAYWMAVHKAVSYVPDDPFALSLNQTMEALLPDYPLLAGNRMNVLVSSDEAFPRMKDAIRRAEKHIHLQTFILANDAIGREFLNLLRQKAEAGVKVRVLYDRFGSARAIIGGLMRRYREVPNMELVGWTQANPIKRQFQVNLRNHRKLLVVDGREAFTGGINLQAGPPMRDYHFAIRGPIVQELQYSFMSDWYFMSDEDPENLLLESYFPHIESEGGAFIRVVNGGPTDSIEALTDIFFAAITAARRELLAVTPYMVPPPDIVRALRSAALRGVDVRVVVPEKNNHPYAGLASRGLYDELLSAGVRIFERRPPFIHAKALIVDSKFAIVGTANLDVRSLRLNYETNLAVHDERFIDDLKRVIIEDVSLSREIDLGTWRARPLRQKLLENFCGLMTPAL